MSMFLTQPELREFTGKTYPKKQAKYLAERGYKFEQRDDGRIVMLRSHLEEMLGAPTKKKPSEPNFAALESLMRSNNGKKKTA